MSNLIRLDAGVRIALDGFTLPKLSSLDGGQADVQFLSKEGLVDYLTNKITQSLTMKLKTSSPTGTLDRFGLILSSAPSMGDSPWPTLFENYGSSKHGFVWEERIRNWSDGTVILWYSSAISNWVFSTKREFIAVMKRKPEVARTALPFFVNHVLNLKCTKITLINHAAKSPLFEGDMVSTSNLCQEIGLSARLHASNLCQEIVLPNKENTIQKEKTMFDKLKNQNVEAVKLAGQLTVGKTANNLLADALLSKLPWYSRLLGGSALKESPFAKLATANLAVVLSTHFGKGNEQLAYVTDAMLKDAMVELVRDGEIVENLLSQLTSLAGTVTGSEVK